MKKKIIVLALCVLMISGCGSKIPKLSNGSEAIVTLKDDAKISVDDLYNELKSDYALDALINMIDKKILEEKYADQVEAAKADTETIMTQLEGQYGDQLQEMIQQYTGYPTIEAYKNAYYLSYLKNLVVKDYCAAQITDKEIEKYYKNEIVGDIKVSHILISAQVTDDMTDEEKATKETEAKAKIESIINELKNTKDADIQNKFAELAKTHSEDETTKENGGSLGFINKDTLSESYDELVKAAYKLKDGAYSTKVITTELGYHVILRLETKEKAALDEIKDTIIETLGAKYLEENQEANVKALQELRKEYNMEITDDELQEKYASYIQNQLNYYAQSGEENSTEKTK